jgi:hypothetical protein
VAALTNGEPGYAYIVALKNVTDARTGKSIHYSPEKLKAITVALESPYHDL